MTLTSVDIDDEWYRLIPSRFPPVDLYAKVASPAEFGVVFAIEGLTNPRLREVEVISRGADHGMTDSPRLQNWNHAPFAYKNPEGGHFLPAESGGLELGDSLQTALAVSVRKRELFLSRTDEPASNLDMRVLSARIQGTFADGRGLPVELSQLERWKIGQRLLEEEANGLVYRCPVRPSATCLAIIDNRVMERSVQRQHFRFVWDGHRITRLYDFAKGEPIEADRLFRAETALAA